MLIINNEEIESLLTVNLALQALERAYVGQANGTAVNRPRSDLYLRESMKAAYMLSSRWRAAWWNPKWSHCG
jgi:ornithine cyclodeaminase/alanine dehydrogenase-like protein (mu-crystallin family)